MESLKFKIMHIISSGAVWLFLLVIFDAFLNLSAVNDTLWGDKQLIEPRNIPEGGLSPKRYSVRRKILLYHNFFRTKVKPTAANMQMMSWHSGAAEKAQTYADKCIFLKHNPGEENALPDLGFCGQNIFTAALKAPWFFAIKSWFAEYKNFTYGREGVDLEAVGHYTAMVWATTSKLGCGLAKCTGGPWGVFYNYICHYCPAGNFDGAVQFPYKVGAPCSDCADHCAAGLCTNPCTLQNSYSNCHELIKDKTDDLCQQHACNATCFCEDKLYKNYPWT